MKPPKTERVNHSINLTLQLAGYIKQSFNTAEAIAHIDNAIYYLQQTKMGLEESMLRELPEDAFNID